MAVNCISKDFAACYMSKLLIFKKGIMGSENEIFR